MTAPDHIAVTMARLDREEIKSIYCRLTASGQLCDECSLPLLEGERGKLPIVAVAGIHLLFSTCEKCGATDIPNIRKAAQRISERVISESAADFLATPKETVN